MALDDKFPPDLEMKVVVVNNLVIFAGESPHTRYRREKHWNMFNHIWKCLSYLRHSEHFIFYYSHPRNKEQSAKNKDVEIGKYKIMEHEY